MDSILQFIQQNPITTIFLLAVAIIASILAITRRADGGAVDPADLLPSYKRFERREIERGDRRKRRESPATGEERRQGPRRKRD